MSEQKETDMIFCITHKFGSINEDSPQKQEHEDNSNGNCKWEAYDPQKHNDSYKNSKIIKEKLSFESLVGDKRIKKDILDYKIKTLRPITYSKSNNTKMILVYLPTKKTIEKIRTTKDDEFVTSTEIQWVNSAYFLISKTDSNGINIRDILPFDDEFLKQNYRINVLSEWNDIRWDILDCRNWVDEKNITEDPKELYDLLDKTTKKYLEYADVEYTKFNLWAIATYFYDLFPAFPYYDYVGTKRAGKTKSLEFQKHICYNAIMSPDVTGSSLFRIIEGIGATILLDETEEFKNKKNEQAQTVKNLLMQAFLKDQYAIRSDTTKDKNFTPTQYNIYSPKALAHINSFDDVLEDRCLRQTMKRALDTRIINTNVSEKDPLFQIIRNKCYRLFLDHADQIYDLQEEAATRLGITGRELQLWVPIMTFAIFFEKFGVNGLVDDVILNMVKSKEDRQLSDEEESKDLKVLDYLGRFGIELALNDKNEKAKNPPGWIAIQLLYNGFSSIMQETYQINSEYFTRRTLSKTLDRFGFIKNKKQDGISYLITKITVNEIKTRMGICEYDESEQNKSEQMVETISNKITSFTSLSSEIGTKTPKITENEKFRNLEKTSESSEINTQSSDEIIADRHKSEPNEVNELNEVKNTKPLSCKYTCKNCSTSWTTDLPLNEIQSQHDISNENHTVVQIDENGEPLEY